MEPLPPHQATLGTSSEEMETSFKLHLGMVISVKQMSIYGLSVGRSQMCDSENHWVKLLLAREKKKGEEIHKAIIHV